MDGRAHDGFKLLEAAATHWRKVSAPESVAVVRAGVRFMDGTRVERQPQKREKRVA